jgi:hypothetical protein
VGQDFMEPSILIKAIETELRISVTERKLKDILAMYKRNRAPAKVALSEAIKFVMRAECSLEQSNNIHTALQKEGITL